jgi:hypothetical protein
MRARQLLLVVGGTSALVAVVALGPGCGGSGSTTASDSGADGTTTDAEGEATVPGGDTGTEASGPGASSDASAEANTLPLICRIDADISDLNIPDASIGDSGISVGVCYSCITSKCGAQVSACNADCSCKENVESLVLCIASGSALTTCAGNAVTSNDAATTELLGCLVGSPCLQTCGGGAI